MSDLHFIDCDGLPCNCNGCIFPTPEKRLHTRYYSKFLKDGEQLTLTTVKEILKISILLPEWEKWLSYYLEHIENITILRKPHPEEIQPEKRRLMFAPHVNPPKDGEIFYFKIPLLENAWLSCCCQCCRSSGHTEVIEYLEKNGIKFQQGKIFDIEKIRSMTHVLLKSEAKWSKAICCLFRHIGDKIERKSPHSFVANKSHKCYKEEENKNYY